MLPPETCFDDNRSSSGSPPGLRFASAVEDTKSCHCKQSSVLSFILLLRSKKIQKFGSPQRVLFSFKCSGLIEVLLPLPPLFDIGMPRGVRGGGRQQRSVHYCNITKSSYFKPKFGKRFYIKSSPFQCTQLKGEMPWF